ncbi:two-component system regulatory protein YycI [Heyndrickxia ginsengihumi]|uniref:two-component system regulatory protein YycI n=1 Tax=Heyndrickxia ginsengihumi TaxID=363870 RepID=UPI003D1A635A
MDWSKTKTMFIVVFLILDIFLAIVFGYKHTKNQYAIFANPTEEQSLKEAGISYNNLPKGRSKRPYISASQKQFTDKDIKKLKNQQASIVNKTMISSTFDKPIKLGKSLKEGQLEAVVEENVLNGNQYKYWSYNKTLNQVIFYQTYENKRIFQNSSAQLIVYLNDKNEMIGYDQTYLTKITKYKEAEETLSAIKALETLYKKGMIKPNSKVVDTDLGYYTRVPKLQVLVPTWHFVVQHGGKTEHLFVNAFEGQVNKIDNNE